MAVAEPKVLWTPSPERVERATLTRYQRWLAEDRGLEFEGYHDLWRWSVFDLEAFWRSIVDFLGVRFSGFDMTASRRLSARSKRCTGVMSSLASST